MYQCVECGAVFDSPHLWTEPHGETRCGCPWCGGGAVLAQRCVGCGPSVGCGRWVRHDELYGPLCRRCAMAAITPQRAAAYARARVALPAFYAAYAAGEAAVRSWVADDEIALEDFVLWLEDGG